MHKAEKFLWRDFGKVCLQSSSTSHQPGVISWLDTLREKDFITERDRPRIIAVGLVSQGAPSNTPINEILDDVRVNIEVLADKMENGWVTRIDNEVKHTEDAIKETIAKLANDIQKIRNIDTKGFVEDIERTAYFAVDQPFRKWLSEINIKTDKEKQIFYWRCILRKLLIDQADELMQSASNRDYLGNEKGENIALAYRTFLININKILPKEVTNYE